MGSPQLPPAKRKTVRAQDEERRQKKDVIADTTLTIAETNIDKAMGYTLKVLPYEFLSRSKTSFGKSLPGQHCYFKGRWSLDLWDNQARYLIFDDIPWDKFDKWCGFLHRQIQARTNISVSPQRRWLEAQDRHPRAVASSLEDEHSSSMILRGNADPLDAEQF
ncbi:unnamed protein product [Adineta steineri]|uniref:Uncharacterized protein n=3 Tax=Adineta steineri TaxID=433720 RepID=A0A818U5K5_9BILA|nr:unnamed protein product [Adineta steineri]